MLQAASDSLTSRKRILKLMQKENSKRFFSRSHSSNLLNFNCPVLTTAKRLKDNNKENISRIRSFQSKISTMYNSI